MGEGIERVVVLGAGVMGRGIAHVSALAGYQTTLVDLDPQVLDEALGQIQANLDKGIARGKTSPEDRDRTLANLELSGDLASVAAAADLIVEAIPEDMELKQRIFRELDQLAPPTCILGTNTSSLSIAAIASVTSRPDRVIGTHFFNPVHMVRLLEIIRSESTSDETLTRLQVFGERTGREMIVVRDSPGFATSRLGLALGLEAIRMLEDGVASAEDIDRAMELGYRHPMGPLRLTDLVGLDTRLKIAEILHRELGGDHFRPPELLRELVRQGKLGKKTGHGFYDW